MQTTNVVQPVPETRATYVQPPIRSRCEPTRSLMHPKEPMPWRRGPTVLVGGNTEPRQS